MRILVYYRFKIIQLEKNKNEKLFSPLLLATLIWLSIPPRKKNTKLKYEYLTMDTSSILTFIFDISNSLSNIGILFLYFSSDIKT